MHTLLNSQFTEFTSYQIFNSGNSYFTKFIFWRIYTITTLYSTNSGFMRLIIYRIPTFRYSFRLLLYGVHIYQIRNLSDSKFTEFAFYWIDALSSSYFIEFILLRGHGTLKVVKISNFFISSH